MGSSLQHELEAAVDGEVRFDRVTRALYSPGASVYQSEPLGVVIPKSSEAVIRAVNIAAHRGVPITPRGGGTSQAGQSIGAGIVLDTSKHLNRVLDIDPDERFARVEPGVVLDELNATLRQHNLRFAPDVSSASTNAANNGRLSTVWRLSHAAFADVGTIDRAVSRAAASSGPFCGSVVATSAR